MEYSRMEVDLILFKGIQVEAKEIKHGGSRRGAGRPSVGSDKYRSEKQRFLEARGISPATAAEILDTHNERAIWKRILTCKDVRVQLDAVKFLTMMRDGKPAQRISLTATTVNMTAEDIARARVIVGEIMSASPNLGLADGNNDTPRLALVAHVADGPVISNGNTEASRIVIDSNETVCLEKHNAAEEGEGGKGVGDGMVR